MTDVRVQSAGFFLELSPDWLILRASQNAHGFLGEYHQRLIGNPISEFTMAQPLHDLRNSLARQRSSTGIARAYRTRLFDDPRRFDIAFQSLESGILLEGLASPDHGVGDWLGSVSRLIDGLHVADRKRMLEGAARRMRALTGFDRATLTIGDERIESARGSMPQLNIPGELPPIIADARAEPIALFPPTNEQPIPEALLRAPAPEQIDALRSAGISSVLRVPVVHGRETLGHFQCDNRNPCPPSFELHAAAELFAQVFAMVL